MNSRNSPSLRNTSLSGYSESSRVGQLHNLSSTATYDLAGVEGTSGNQNLHNNSEIQLGNIVQTSGTASGQENSVVNSNFHGQSPEDAILNLECPLCRGAIVGSKIEKEARQYLDLKQRSCSHESCSFIGNYQELRGHARRAHPTKHPADIDPSRAQAWQNLEHQRDYGDIMSVIRSSMPNAVVFGDYVIDNEDAGDDDMGDGHSSWWSTFVLFQMVNRNNSRRGLPQIRGRSRLWTRQRRLSMTVSSRRHLWGEGSSRQITEEDSWNRSSRRAEDPSPRPCRRRSYSNSRPDENQQ